MASKVFDFNKIKRSFFTATLKDGRKLIAKMPKKKTFEKLAAVQEIDQETLTPDEAMDTLAEIVAEALSNNMTGEKITREDITKDYDIEEMSAFIDSYMEFISGVKKDPN